MKTFDDSSQAALQEDQTGNSNAQSRNLYPELDLAKFIGKVSGDSKTPLLIRKRTGWKGFSSLEKSLSIALGLVSVLALALMIAVIIVGVQLNKDDYKAPEKLTETTLYPPWVTTIPTTTEYKEVTTRVRPTTILTSTTPISPIDNETDTCDSDQCRQILRSLDTRVDPCENFYNFACGRWTIENPASHDNPVVDQFSKMQESFQQEIKNILETDKANELELDAVDIAKQFYETCLNQTDTQDEGNTGIRKLIEDMLMEFDNSTGELIPILSRIRRELDGNYIFSMWIDIHLENNTQNAIYVDHGNYEVLGEILTAINETERVHFYKEFIVDVWTSVFPEDSDIVDEIATDLMDFEHKLLELHRSNNTEEFMRVEIISTANALESDNYTNILQFVNETMSLVQEEFCTNMTCSWSEDLDIILNDIQYFSTIDALLNETDFKTTVNYLKWRIMLDFAKHSSELFRDFYDRKILGLKNTKPRWEMCVDEAIRFFGPPLIAEYIAATISDPTEFKQQVLEIVDLLKHTTIKLIQEVTWITSNTTRAWITQKLEEMQIFVLYPPSLTDANILQVLDFYSDLNLTNPSSHFQNMLDLTKWDSYSELKLIWADANVTMERKELEIQTSNEVMYSYLTNSLYLPTGAFRQPIYNDVGNNSMAFTYGAWTLIGRQFIQAVEATAVSYVKGSPVGMWDEKTLSNFESSTDCLKDQYNAYNVSGLNNSSTINGESTVKMNTLDVGGFKVALTSYLYTKGLLGEGGIQGLGYSSDQIFFIGFAQAWCASYTEERLLQEVTQGSQTPVPYRVNAVVEAFDEFGKAWNCPKPVVEHNNVCHLW